jgi:hypothetical protein
MASGVAAALPLFVLVPLMLSGASGAFDRPWRKLSLNFLLSSSYVKELAISKVLFLN